MKSFTQASPSNSSLPNIRGDIDFEFSFAFQPIVNAATREIIAFEALVRGPRGEPSADVLAKVREEDFQRFDQACRLRAINLASKLNLRKNINLNMLPNGYYQTGMTIRATLQAAMSYGFPLENIIFEVTESEELTDNRRLIDHIRMYQEFGFHTAIDDFGTGYSGLRLLVDYQPNYIKLDRNLIADIHEHEVRQVIVKGISYICSNLSIEMIAEGVEKAEEYRWLRTHGIDIFQGYYFAYPAFEALPEVAADLYSY